MRNLGLLMQVILQAQDGHWSGSPKGVEYKPGFGWDWLFSGGLQGMSQLDCASEINTGCWQKMLDADWPISAWSRIWS